MEYVTLRQMAKKLYESDKETVQSFDDYYSEMNKKYKIIMGLLGLDPKLYKVGKSYNIPIKLKPFFIFFLSQLKKNPVLKNLTKQKRSQDKEYKSESERISYILSPNYKGTKNENIRNEFIRFILDTDLIDDNEKYDYLLTLSMQNNEIYEVTSMHLFEDMISKVKKIQNKIAFNDKVDLINLKERLILIEEYNKKIDDLIEAIDIAKDILDAENQDIILGVKPNKDIHEKIKYCIKEAENEINYRKENIIKNKEIDEGKLKDIREFLKL